MLTRANLIGIAVSVVLGAHALLVLAGAIATLRRPGRAAAMMAGEGESAGGRVVLFLVPFQLVIALLLARTAYELATESGGPAHMVFMLAAFAVMELGFIAVRARLGVARGAGAALSAILALVYAVTAALIGLAD